MFRHAVSLVNSTEFNVEFEWAYTQPEYEGKGFGSGLATLLLEGISESVFATAGIENVAMRHILEGRDFFKSGFGLRPLMRTIFPKEFSQSATGHDLAVHILAQHGDPTLKWFRSSRRHL